MKVEDLDVFKLAHGLTLKIYELTKAFPDAERFGLISQMRRASSLICMNLIEGAHRVGKKEYRYFINVAKGSCGEVKYQLLLSKDLSFISEDDFNNMSESCERISMMLTRLYQSIKS